MDKQADEPKDEYDAILRAFKDEYQKRSRELVRSGACSQDAMLFIPKEVVKRTTFHRRTDEF
jgi:hypothetical protein